MTSKDSESIMSFTTDSIENNEVPTTEELENDPMVSQSAKLSHIMDGMLCNFNLNMVIISILFGAAVVFALTNLIIYYTVRGSMVEGWTNTRLIVAYAEDHDYQYVPILRFHKTVDGLTHNLDIYDTYEKLTISPQIPTSYLRANYTDSTSDYKRLIHYGENEREIPIMRSDPEDPGMTEICIYKTRDTYGIDKLYCNNRRNHVRVPVIIVVLGALFGTVSLFWCAHLDDDARSIEM